MDVILKKKFSEINLNDDFFSTLKADYPGFNVWFTRLSQS